MCMEMQLTNFFDIYRNKKVVIFGVTKFSIKFLKLLRYANIDVVAFCSFDSETIGKQIKNVVLDDEEVIVDLPVISLKQLIKLYFSEPTVIQLGVDKDEELSIIKAFEELKIQNFISQYQNLSVINHLLKLYDILKIWPKDKNLFSLVHKNCVSVHEFSQFFSFLTTNKNPVFLIMPPKTGNHSVIEAMEHAKIPHYISKNYHTPQIYSKEVFSSIINTNIKIITAVRDPIAQVVSLFFQLNNSFNGIVTLLPTASIDFYENLQEHFDSYIKYYDSDDSFPPYFIPNFFHQFNNNVFNIMDFPFDKEAGYSIIKYNCLDIFVYQLEKLNGIYPKFFDWISSPNEKIIKANTADNKIIAKAYKEFLDNFTISRDFFEKCYDNPVMKHFYSQSDIDAFKTRWEKHIK